MTVPYNHTIIPILISHILHLFLEQLFISIYIYLQSEGFICFFFFEQFFFFAFLWAFFYSYELSTHTHFEFVIFLAQCLFLPFNRFGTSSLHHPAFPIFHPTLAQLHTYSAPSHPTFRIIYHSLFRPEVGYLRLTQQYHMMRPPTPDKLYIMHISQLISFHPNQVNHILSFQVIPQNIPCVLGPEDDV